MKRSLILLFLVCLAFVITVPAQKKPKKVKMPKVNADMCQLPNSVTALDLSHESISAFCPEDSTSCKADLQIKVRSTAFESKMPFKYVVSGGRVIGEGPNIIWDLTGVPPGTYRITVGVLQETGFSGRPLMVIGQTQTRTVEILDCADCPIPEEATDK